MASHIRTRTFDWTVTRRADGWKPDCCPNFDPGLPHVVAHDVIEHLDDRSSFDGELRAFGVTMFGRMTVHPDGMYEASGSDLSSFLAMQDYKVKAPPKSLASRKLSHGAEHMLDNFMEEAEAQTARKAVWDGYKNPGAKPNVQRFLEVQEAVRGWVRIGYRVAARRFKKFGPHGVDKLYGDLTKAIERDYQRTPAKPGDTLTISVNLDTFDIKLHRGHRSPEVVEEAKKKARQEDPNYDKESNPQDEMDAFLNAMFGIRRRSGFSF